jgi:hypothetical protein
MKQTNGMEKKYIQTLQIFTVKVIVYYEKCVAGRGGGEDWVNIIKELAKEENKRLRRH